MLTNEHYAYILLSKEKWYNRIFERSRTINRIHVFVRRNRVGPVKTQKLFFYVNKPVMQIRGVADFNERLAGNHKELWRKHGSETCFNTFNEYARFLQGRETATFILFTNFRELDNPVSIEVISKILGVRRLTPMGKYLNRENADQLTV